MVKMPKASSNPLTSTNILFTTTFFKKHSSCFGALSSFKEGKELVVEFDDMDSAAFNLVTYWLYHGKFPKTPATGDVYTLIRTHVIADRLLMPNLKDFVMTNLQKMHRRGATAAPADLFMVQNLELSHKSYIARYFVDLLAHKAVSGEAVKFLQDGMLGSVDRELFERGGEMVVQLMEEILQRSRVPKGGACPSLNDHCAYHEHENAKVGHDGEE